MEKVVVYFEFLFRALRFEPAARGSRPGPLRVPPGDGVDLVHHRHHGDAQLSLRLPLPVPTVPGSARLSPPAIQSGFYRAPI